MLRLSTWIPSTSRTSIVSCSFEVSMSVYVRILHICDHPTIASWHTNVFESLPVYIVASFFLYLIVPQPNARWLVKWQNQWLCSPPNLFPQRRPLHQSNTWPIMETFVTTPSSMSQWVVFMYWVPHADEIFKSWFDPYSILTPFPSSSSRPVRWRFRFSFKRPRQCRGKATCQSALLGSQRPVDWGRDNWISRASYRYS